MAARFGATVLRDLGANCAGDMVSPYMDCFFEQCITHASFSYGLAQAYTASDHYDNAHFDGDASLLLGGLSVWGERSVECTTTSATAEADSDEEWVDTADSPAESVDDRLP